MNDPITDGLKSALANNPGNPFLQGHVEALDNRKVPMSDRKLADSISRSDFLEYQAAKASEIAIMQGQLAEATELLGKVESQDVWRKRYDEAIETAVCALKERDEAREQLARAMPPAT